MMTALVLLATQALAAPGVYFCHGDIEGLAAEGARWDAVQEEVDGIVMFIDRINAAEPDTLARLAKLTREKGLTVGVECGGLLEFYPEGQTIGAWSAAHEIAKVRKFTDAGGRVDFLNFDGPIRRALKPDMPNARPLATLDDALGELVVAMRAWRAAYPHMAFNLLTNFPNWGWKGETWYHAIKDPMGLGDYHVVVQEALRFTKEAGLPLEGVVVDNPYEFAVGIRKSAGLADPGAIDWMARINELARLVKEGGYDYTLILNSEVGGGESGQAYHEGTIRFIEFYHERGEPADAVILESWYEHPVKAVPETEPHTMTWHVREALPVLKAKDKE
jgi:hypothetical protein